MDTANTQRKKDIAAGGTMPATSRTTIMLVAQHSIANAPAITGGGAKQIRMLLCSFAFTQSLVNARHYG